MREKGVRYTVKEEGARNEGVRRERRGEAGGRRQPTWALFVSASLCVGLSEITLSYSAIAARHWPDDARHTPRRNGASSIYKCQVFTLKAPFIFYQVVNLFKTGGAFLSSYRVELETSSAPRRA